MGFFDDITENPKTTLFSVGIASIAVFLGYSGYQKYNEKNKPKNEEEKKNQIEKKLDIKLKEYKSDDLLLNFSYPSNFSIQKIESKESGCFSLKIYNPMNIKEEISIICEYLNPNLTLETYYEQSVQHLKSTIKIKQEEKKNQKIRNFDSIYFEHSLQVSNFKKKKN